MDPLLDQVLEAYPDNVKVVYKHFPLSSHRQARPAAEAAVYAMKNGKFMEMHELIFKNYRQLSLQKLKELGGELGLDVDGLQKAVSSQSGKSVIDKDLEDGRKAQVTGTPTLFVNGKRLQRRDLATIKRLIDEALKGEERKASAGSPGH